MERERSLRIFFALLVGVSAVGLAYGYAISSSRTTFESHLDAAGVRNPGATVAPPRRGITVVATDSNSWRGKESGGPRARAELVAFDADGSVRYYNDTHTRYWDLDGVNGTRATVEYAYADHLNASACPTRYDYGKRMVSPTVWKRYAKARSTDACTRNGYERVNRTTGELTRIWTRITPGKEATRYHDIERVDGTHLLVADIYLDRVMEVNTTTGATVWTWNASDVYPRDAGGPYPEDWTHINDVKLLPDGRIMVSVRNMDQVVFLNESGGMIDSWTLGTDGNHSILYAQHNPDYIPSKDGGPAVVVADSENNRLVEYQREGGRWKQTWVWRDARLQWPRDADRLPNGHTLVTDSNGNRVFELDRQGNVVWNVNIAFPYEAERLGTGPESTNGPSATAAGLRSRRGNVEDKLLIFTKSFLPGKYLNGLMYVTPVWMGLPEVLALALLIVSALVWTALTVRHVRSG
ncbi:MAG: aryl-sulfate sulfotransferase [Salinigranum sp.]